MDNGIIEFLFSFQGRINRKQYWLYTIALLIILLVPATLIYGFATSEADTIFTTGSLITLWPSLAIQTKRWHDRNKSAWWILINFIPILNIWALIENGFLKGDDTANTYGHPPYE